MSRAILQFWHGPHGFRRARDHPIRRETHKGVALDVTFARVVMRNQFGGQARSGQRVGATDSTVCAAVQAIAQGVNRRTRRPTSGFRFESDCFGYGRFSLGFSPPDPTSAPYRAAQPPAALNRAR
ncbi:hypothetical protein CLV54_1960 [Compostimonas suwonensis]|uniref:Uncharacterized protein n=1 Tax=Compostimonas suwonensis TaxID=1048394 RepID=A0A2M9BW75_9MICO|nr:hypothetical protein CLV54_1960 [Compostimonas suwonensis]